MLCLFLRCSPYALIFAFSLFLAIHLSKQGNLYLIGSMANKAAVSTNYADGRSGISFLGLGSFRQVAPVSVEQASRLPWQYLWKSKSSLSSYRKKKRVFTLNTSICSVDDPEYTRM